MGTTRGTVFVIDDEAAVREGLARLLRSAEWNVHSFAAARDFLDTAPHDGLGCILLDVGMPEMTGPQLHDELRAGGYSYPVIYLTGQGTVSVGVRAMRQGAFDFLEKPVDGDQLLSVIETAIARHEDARSRENRLGDIRQRLAHLSAREREVMDHVIQGRLNKQIADDLDISLKTVKVHRGRAMAKMGVHSVAQLVHLCDALGIGQTETAALA